MANPPEDDAIITVFRAIALSDDLSNELVLKGGNALKYIFKSPRASVDLDFTEVTNYSNISDEELNNLLENLCDQFDECLRQIKKPGSYTDLLVQSSKVKPANVDYRENPAFEIRIGYSKSKDRTPPYPDVVKLEITLNDIICENIPYEIDGKKIRVCSLNDIIAEKLRALIQQKTRNRFRPGDVFDIWFFHTRLKRRFNYDKISDFLIKKSEGKVDRSFVRKATFSSEEVKGRAKEGFEEVEERVSGIIFPTFEEAYKQVLALVEKLSIPD